MQMVWYEAKHATNLLPEPDGQGLDFVDARDRFEWKTAIIVPTYPAAQPAEGALDDPAPLQNDKALLVRVLFDDPAAHAVDVAPLLAPLGTEAVSAISLRPASRKERTLYDEA